MFFGCFVDTFLVLFGVFLIRFWCCLVFFDTFLVFFGCFWRWFLKFLWCLWGLFKSFLFFLGFSGRWVESDVFVGLGWDFCVVCLSQGVVRWV